MQCPAKDATCHRCNKKGHYGVQCLSKRKQVSEVVGGIDSAFLGEVDPGQNTACSTTLQLNRRKTQFKLDTGAEATAISMETYRALQRPKISPPKKSLYGPSRQPLDCIGQFSGKFYCKGKTTTQPVYVIRGLKSNLLGLPAITALKLAIRVNTTTTEPAEVMDNHKKQFPSLFKGLGNLGEPFEIHLKTGSIPHCIYILRHVSLPLREKVKQELDRMESTGFIKKISDPTAWCGGMVIVPKKEAKIRICAFKRMCTS